jgi:hypothetical protein
MPARHANIVGWPADKSAQKLCAQELAARATLKLPSVVVSGSPPVECS